MNHDEASLLLTEYLQDRLENPTREAVAEHLTRCPECQAARDTALLLSTRPHRGLEGTPELADYDTAIAIDAPSRTAGQVSTGPHPTTDEIAAFAAFPARLDAETSARLAAHLEECAECSSDAEVVRRADAEAGHGEQGVPDVTSAGSTERVTWWKPALGLAAAVAFVLAVPAYRGISLLPRTAREVDHLQREIGRYKSEVDAMRSSLERNLRELEEAKTWSGPVALRVLKDPLRDSEEEIRLSLTPGQPYLPLAVAPGLPEEISPGETLGFEIRSHTGTPIWRMEMPTRKVRQELRASQVVTFLVPSSGLSPGRYSFRVVRSGSLVPETLLEVTFRISTED